MSHTVTVRLTKELAGWLEVTARRRGVSQGKIIRDHLENARAHAADQAFMQLAGSVAGPRIRLQRPSEQIDCARGTLCGSRT